MSRESESFSETFRESKYNYHKILYKDLTHSRQDYGSPMYNIDSKFVLKLLDLIQTQSLRLALGAFCISPTLVSEQKLLNLLSPILD